ncbi:MAG: SIS domain-containing protein [Terracidiphilus sp.]|nr:SIS domain-containing protein [Terracidiphilus sp.]
MADIAEPRAGSPAGTIPAAASETRLFADILNEPAQLARSLVHMFGDGKPALDAAAAVLRKPSPLIISGIGASWHAGMAMQARLLDSGLPALLIDASELLHSAEVPRGATVVLLSRSGKSTEIVQLVQKCRAKSASIVAITNQADSPLAQGADIVLNTSTEFDHAVSVTTYTAIALASALLAAEATDRSAQPIVNDLLQSLSNAEAQIPAWRKAIEQSGWLSAGDGPTYFLARGAGLASCHEARLLWEEAAKRPATALTSGGFRHGPQEIVREGLCVGMWIDAEKMRAQDLELTRDLRRHGARVLLIGQELEQGAADCVLNLPPIPAQWQFLIDIIPIQIAAERLAALRGEDPDAFRLCSYIVENEGGLGHAAQPPTGIGKDQR